jgi:hypothetical protein
MSLSRWLSSEAGKRTRKQLRKGVEEITRLNDNIEKMFALLNDPLVGGTLVRLGAKALSREDIQESIRRRIVEVLDG